MTVPDVISGLIWRFMYNPTSGIINDILMRIGIGGDYVEWLARPGLVLPSVIIADVWRGYPFVLVILLAGLQAIPKELYEAARVDGASRLQEFFHVTIPGVMRITLIALALDTIWQIRRFGLIYNFEYASAIAVVMAVVMLAISYPYIRTITRKA